VFYVIFIEDWNSNAIIDIHGFSGSLERLCEQLFKRKWTAEGG